MNKANKIFTVISIVVTVLLIVAIIVTMVWNSKQKKQNEIETPTESTTETATDEPNEIIIPSVDTDKESETTPKPDIDITDMGRNPNAEVVDAKIEYGTKERD